MKPPAPTWNTPSPTVRSSSSRSADATADRRHETRKPGKHDACRASFDRARPSDP
ncbi:hypothetical protein [Palleronia salina]|uniref:hypothetical protein n=1 Tax=Palleronia salina TaxID=313368 RepID=UPI00357126E3